MNVTTPVNTTAELYISTNDVDNILEGKSKLSKSKDIKIIKTTSTEVVLYIGSGVYNFTIKN